MARPTFWILLFLLMVNGASVAFEQSGMAEDFGIDVSISDQGLNDRFKTETENYDPNTGSASFMAGLITDASSVALGLLRFALAAPIIFEQLGIPAWINQFFFGPMYAVILFDGIYLTIGRAF